MKSLTGQNVLTVLIAKREDQTMRMFFCPYTRNRTSQYKGAVKAVLPGYDPEQEILIMTRPQKAYENINYTFKITEQESNTVDFWIQDQYFMEQVIRTYHCHVCGAPSLYYAGNKTVMFSNKADVKQGESFDCINPLCKENYTYHGIVKITAVTDTLE